LDGFSEVLGIPEDWDFLARLVLSGFEMDVVPKGIYFYRLRKGGRFRSTWSGNSIETLRRRLLATADPSHEKLIHSLLLREISENERLRASVWKLDRKVVKIVLRMSKVISEEHRLIIQKLTVPVWRKIKGMITNAARFVRGWNLMLGKSHRANHRTGPSVESRIDSSIFFVKTLSDSEFQDQLTYLGLPSNRRIFGFMGGLTEENRPLGFLRLAYWTQMSSDNSFFVMVGDGPLRDEVIAAETKYNLKNFNYLPSIEKPEELYALLSGLVITSASEQDPKEMFEALASGVPVFSTDVGEAKRVLGQYGSGLVVTHDPRHKDFANCFKLWKDNLEIYKAATMETADLIRMRIGAYQIRQYH
jgi:glycosyltransferase involved in cell wall biosynthesis